MLPKMERLTTEDFKDIRPKVFFRGPLFDAAYVASPTQKFACVISKKKIKKATGRNAVKRKVIEAIRELRPQKNKHIIFYIKAIPKETSYGEIKEEISKAFATLH